MQIINVIACVLVECLIIGGTWWLFSPDGFWQRLVMAFICFIIAVPTIIGVFFAGATISDEITRKKNFPKRKN